MSANGADLSPLTSRDVWVFDLDNTLYPAECDLFAQIDQRMTDFVARFLRLERAEARDDDSIAEVDNRIDRSEGRTQRQVDDLKERVDDLWGRFLDYALTDTERDLSDP